MADKPGQPRIVRYNIPVLPQEGDPLFRSVGDQLFTRAYKQGDTVILPLEAMGGLIHSGEFDAPTVRGHDELMDTVQSLYDVTSKEKVLGLPLNSIIEFLTKSNMTMKQEFIKQLSVLPFEDLVAGINDTPFHESVKKQLAEFFYEYQTKGPKQLLVPGKQSIIEFPDGMSMGPLEGGRRREGRLEQAPEIITEAPIDASDYDIVEGPDRKIQLDPGQYWTSQEDYARGYLEGGQKPGIWGVQPTAEEWQKIRSPELVKSLRGFSADLHNKGIKGSTLEDVLILSFYDEIKKDKPNLELQDIMPDSRMKRLNAVDARKIINFFKIKLPGGIGGAIALPLLGLLAADEEGAAGGAGLAMAGIMGPPSDIKERIKQAEARVEQFSDYGRRGDAEDIRDAKLEYTEANKELQRLRDELKKPTPDLEIRDRSRDPKTVGHTITTKGRVPKKSTFVKVFGAVNGRSPSKAELKELVLVWKSLNNRDSYELKEIIETFASDPDPATRAAVYQLDMALLVDEYDIAETERITKQKKAPSAITARKTEIDLKIDKLREEMARTEAAKATMSGRGESEIMKTADTRIKDLKDRITRLTRSKGETGAVEIPPWLQNEKNKAGTGIPRKNWKRSENPLVKEWTGLEGITEEDLIPEKPEPTDISDDPRRPNQPYTPAEADAIKAGIEADARAKAADNLIEFPKKPKLGPVLENQMADVLTTNPQINDMIRGGGVTEQIEFETGKPLWMVNQEAMEAEALRRRAQIGLAPPPKVDPVQEYDRLRTADKVNRLKMPKPRGFGKLLGPLGAAIDTVFIGSELIDIYKDRGAQPPLTDEEKNKRLKELILAELTVGLKPGVEIGEALRAEELSGEFVNAAPWLRSLYKKYGDGTTAQEALEAELTDEELTKVRQRIDDDEAAQKPEYAPQSDRLLGLEDDALIAASEARAGRYSMLTDRQKASLPPKTNVEFGELEQLEEDVWDEEEEKKALESMGISWEEVLNE